MDMYRFEMLEYRGKMPLPLKIRNVGVASSHDRSGTRLQIHGAP
ncbi:MAG: hypothetical protein P8X80_16570 [Desulfobacterales bacterium]